MRFQLIADTRSTSLGWTPVAGLWDPGAWSSAVIGSPPDGGRGLGRRGSEHARDAALDLGALERALTHADVVQGLGPLAPRVDLRTVDLACGGRVLEEQGQRQP